MALVAEPVFVYGTLRAGGSRDAARFYPGATFVARGRVRGLLYDFGDYPGLRLDAAAGWVVGDILLANAHALAGLDEWEGIDPAAPNAGEYRRVAVDVFTLPGDAPIACWVYEVSAVRAAGRPVITSGDWLSARAP